MRLIQHPAILVAILVIVLDQVLKYLVTDRIGPDADTHEANIIGNSIGLTYTENRGFAFGLLDDKPALAAVLALTGAAILAVVLWHWWSALTPMAMSGAALIAGGAASNMIDRIRLGYVVDFIDMGRWPNFNLADTALTIGLPLLIFSTWRSETETTLQVSAGAPR